MESLTGTRVGGCRLLEVLGRGGMGVVFRGWQESLDRPVAVKVIHLPSAAAAGGTSQRLFKEARATARLGHPNLVQVIDAGQSGELAYIVMELVLGMSLGSWLRELQRLTTREAVVVALGTARGLHAAHAAGIVHRDVKPDNLLVGAAGATKVADFGLTKLVGEETELTRAGTLLGTPMYMSPEACEGEDVDARSDIYSLGATIFAAIAGEPPFSAKTVPGLLLAHVSKAPPRLRAKAPPVPEALDALVDRMLAKDPSARPATALEVAKALEAIEASLPPLGTGGAENLLRFEARGSTGEDPASRPPPDDRTPAPATRTDVKATGAAGPAPAAPPVGSRTEDAQMVRTVVIQRLPVLSTTGLRIPHAPAPTLTEDELLLRARVYARRGSLRDAERDLRAALTQRAGNVEARFALACTLARLADGDGAFTALEQAVADGFRDAARIRAADALKGLRKDTRWKRILEDAEKS